MKFQMIYQLTGLSYKGGLQSKKTFSEVSLHWPHDLDRILKLISRIAKSITWIPILFRFAEEYYLINPDLHPMSAKGRPWFEPKEKEAMCREKRVLYSSEHHVTLPRTEAWWPHWCPHSWCCCTACLGRIRVSHGFCHRSMAKPIYHGKTHDIWVLPCNGFSHGSMAKTMDIMIRNIHGFCHGPLLHGFCNALFKRKIPKIISLDWHLLIAFSLSLECFLHCSLAFKHFPNIFMKC